MNESNKELRRPKRSSEIRTDATEEQQLEVELENAPQTAQLSPLLNVQRNMPQLSWNANDGDASQLRRPMTSSMSDEIDHLSQQTQQLNFRSPHESHRNEREYNNLAAGDTINTQNWNVSVTSDMIKQNPPSVGLNPYASEFVPRSSIGFYEQNCGPIPYPNGDMYGVGDPIPYQTGNDYDYDFIALSILREFIEQISVRPDKYDKNLSRYTEIINNYIDEDPCVMQSIVNMIVDQAIIDTQFRYNGVRLCIHLMTHLNSRESDTKFDVLLYQRCQREVLPSRLQDLEGSTNGELYLRGIIMFIGDLYSRCNATELAECLPPLLQTLLSHSNTENLKCVCQVLKLCGSTLEKYYTNKETNEVRNVMAKLSIFLNDSEVKPNIRDLISMVVEMQKRQWTAHVPSLNTAPVVNPYVNTNYTYIGGAASCEPEDGEYFNSISDDDDFQLGYDLGGDENDPDVCDAFEEFLRKSGQKR